jgi:hypothetical protein
MSFLLSLVFCSTKLENKRQNRFCPEAGSGDEVVQIMYTHVNKCKNDKIK